jgi:predicted RNA-binding Zn-ribbon protein involved in translation (DUF1610 family)
MNAPRPTLDDDHCLCRPLKLPNGWRTQRMVCATCGHVMVYVYPNCRDCSATVPCTACGVEMPTEAGVA